MHMYKLAFMQVEIHGFDPVCIGLAQMTVKLINPPNF